MAAVVTAGQLDQPIEIEVPANIADGAGGARPGWSRWPTRYYANVQAVAANEAETHGGTRQVSVVLFTVRRQVADKIQQWGGAACRIVWGGRNYDIQDIRLGSSREAFTVISAVSGLQQ